MRDDLHSRSSAATNEDVHHHGATGIARQRQHRRTGRRAFTQVCDDLVAPRRIVAKSRLLRDHRRGNSC